MSNNSRSLLSTLVLMFVICTPISYGIGAYIGGNYKGAQEQGVELEAEPELYPESPTIRESLLVDPHN